jgi:hypothetical protein
MRVCRRFLVVAGFLLAGCGQDSPDPGAREPENWSLVGPTVSIGEVEGDPRYLFQSVAGARRLPDGRIAVADRGQALIRIYGPDGTHQLDLGGEGRGPGEFDYITTLMVRPPDTLVAYDSGIFRLSTFLADGTVLETKTFSVSEGRPEIFLGRYSNGDLAFSWIDLTRQTPSDRRVNPDPMRFGRFDQEGELAAVLGSGTGLRRGPAGVMPFTPQLHAFLFHDTIFHTDGLRAEINVLDPNGVSGRPIPLPVKAVDVSGAEALLRAGLEAEGAEELLRRLSESPSDSIPVLSEVILDELGRFWVKQYDPGSDINWLGAWAGIRGGTWWVVNRIGVPLAWVVFPQELQPLAIYEDAVIGIVRDEFGVQRIQVFPILR